MGGLGLGCHSGRSPSGPVRRNRWWRGSNVVRHRRRGTRSSAWSVRRVFSSMSGFRRLRWRIRRCSTMLIAFSPSRRRRGCKSSATFLAWRILPAVFSCPAGAEDFDDLSRNAIAFEVFGVRVDAASLADIVRSKVASDRPQDRQDVVVLRAMMRKEDR